jgi:hypothetical protein
MAQAVHVRWGWLKGMYFYTIIGAGGLGLGIILTPDAVRSFFGWPVQDQSFSVSLEAFTCPLRFRPSSDCGLPQVRSRLVSSRYVTKASGSSA